MSSSADFATFCTQFFALFSGKSFRGGDYLSYLQRPDQLRSGDEASIVDMAIVSPLLGLLGFEPAEKVYNQQRQNGRPDFAPTDVLYGICFLIEDKSTSLSLSFDLNDSDSHLSQLVGYMRDLQVSLGWLTNGRQLMVWQLDGEQPRRILDIDIAEAIRAWRMYTPSVLPGTIEQSLQHLYALCRKTSFSDSQRLEKEIAIEIDEWAFKALPLGTNVGNETNLVEALQIVVREMQGDARRMLDRHLERYNAYTKRAVLLTDRQPEPAAQQLKTLRDRILSILKDTFQIVWGLETADLQMIEEELFNLEREARLFVSPQEVTQKLLDLINAVRQRKHDADEQKEQEKKTRSKPRTFHLLADFDEFPAIGEPLKLYIDKSFQWHGRQATLRHDYQADLQVYDDYTAWRLLVQETMLGSLDEEQRRNEFALQAAYVVFIRLLLIRVCEDKGVFPHRILSNGGLKHWQEDIKRYLFFVQGNPYSPLLDMAYQNAQNVYAHFFTGRELFNWYRLDQQRFILTLYQLDRFNFAQVDSDIIGTIYNTYVNREEKRNKGQYYTPSAIIQYILDNVGYSGNSIIGPNKRLIDPACGSGSFLVTAAKRLIAAYKGNRQQVDDPIAVLERVRQNLFGFDLNPFACYLAEMNLLIQVLDLVKQAHQSGTLVKLERFNIYNVDALARPSGMYYYINVNTLQAEENDEVNRIKSREHDTPYALGFAFVVANPPYGATLSDEYKAMLRANWQDVFYGQPDTYTFFLKLGLDLLADSGRLGFITPNTYLMGTHTGALRYKLLNSARIEQIVDLPQSIWHDANVDCVLIFLVAEKDEAKRKAQQVQINILGLQNSLDKLASRAWSEVFTQQQERWLSNPRYEITMRYDNLLQHIEDACLVLKQNGEITEKVLRLVDVTDSTQGIIPYHTRTESAINPYIKTRWELPADITEWKPLLDGNSFVGRYELRWGSKQHYLKYGKWLYSVPQARFFESPKLLVQDMRNRSLKRRLVATFDDQKFYNRHNFNNIIAKDANYHLKYILAVFNSSLLNYWFGRLFDNLHINPSYFRQLPIYPADAEMQAIFVMLVDQMLARHAELNVLREQGYIIRPRRDGTMLIEVPYAVLLTELQQADPNFPVLNFFDAKAIGLFTLPDNCDLSATISRNVYLPERYPGSIVLRHNKLWLEVADEALRRYLYGYLRSPQWQGKTWDAIKNTALLPADGEALQRLFALEEQKKQSIQVIQAEIRRIDAEIDERVLDLYGIHEPTDRQRVLGSAPVEDEEEDDADTASLG